MTKRSINVPLVDSDSPLAQRSYHIVTEFGKYFFRVRARSTAKDFASMAIALEKQALELWKKSDSLELEDLIHLVEQQPPKPELIAMIMLTGRSKFKAKADAALGGKTKSSNKFAALTQELQTDWGAYTGKLGKAAFAGKRHDKWMSDNEKLVKDKKQPLELPALDTPRKWLRGIQSARKK
jgi:hypothetical protein